MRFTHDLGLYLRVPLFAAMGEDCLRFLAFTAQKRRIGAGLTLFHAGDYAASGFLVLHGRIEVSGISGLMPQIASDGMLIGELALLTAGERPCTAVALEDTDYAIISREDFRRVLVEFPDAAMKVQSHLQQRIQTTNKDLQRLTATFTR